MDFAFLSSNRFWAIIIGALAIYAKTKEWIGDPEMLLIATVMGAFVTVRTIDRLGDAKVEAATIQSS